LIYQEIQLDINFHHRNGLSFRAIAEKTGTDRRTVKKYIEHPELMGQPRAGHSRESIIDPFRPQIESFLKEDGDYRASWIFDKLVKSGYNGGYELVKVAVRADKQKRQHLAYVRFETEPGRQAQVDFGEFQVLLPDGSTKKYYLFAMILGYSLMLYCEILEKCDMPSFLEAHIRAFDAFGGVPLEILYDRMRNVFVSELAGKKAFTQSLVTLATHYGFTPQVAPAYSPWVKGKIERPMDFVRESWWRGYEFVDLDHANSDLGDWLGEKAKRIHGTTRERVDECFEREKPHLLALPAKACDVSERLFRTVRKDCTIAIDGNRYVVAHTLVGKQVVIRMRGRTLRIFHDDQLIVVYEMPEGKGELVQDPRFYADLLADRAMNARKFGGRNGRKAKGRATISPSSPRYPIDVQQRSMDVYAQIGGEVGYA